MTHNTTQIGDIISVYYETLKEQEIMILYKDGMVVQKSVYDKGEDVLTITFEDGEEVIEDFCSSSIYKTPQEILEYVEDAIENKDYDELKSIEGVSVNVVNDTMVIDYKPLEIDIADEYTERIAITPRAASSFVAPETQFVPYTKKVVATSYKYNSTLNKNVKISVKESMNSYVKEQADLRSFGVATALDVSNNTIINKTSTNYNADILDDGICTVYYPD